MSIDSRFLLCFLFCSDFSEDFSFYLLGLVDYGF